MLIMASFVNSKNVVSYCFIQSDEILLMVKDLTSKSIESYKLKCPFPKNNKTSEHDTKSPKEHYVVSASSSPSSAYISACDSSNVLHLWKFRSNNWEHISERPLLRKCQKIIFTNSEEEMIVADRGGDVFVFSVSDAENPGRFLLGHLRLVIDIAISNDDKYLLTSDRDGKIRVSCYPNSYNIHSYCLGHKEFISSVQCIEMPQKVILSASGDGSIRLWDFDGHDISCANVFENDTLCSKLENYIISNITNENEENQKCTLPYAVEEKQAIFAVKRIRYSQQKQLCAISFYSIKGVAVYLLSFANGDYFSFVQFIPLDSIPFDLFFESNGDLIILQENIDKQYLYFSYTDEKIYVEENNLHTVLIIKKFQELCNNIAELKYMQDDCIILFKRTYENEDQEDQDIDKKNSVSKKTKIV